MSTPGPGVSRVAADVAGAGGTPAFDVERVRRDFPILRRRIRGRPLAYLDNAATTQKPQAVLDALTGYYTSSNANVHRGVHLLSELATEAHDAAREKVRAFLNAAAAREIVFTRNSTEGLNLVAHAFGRWRVAEGDNVVISAMEHHSNIVPWQMLCAERGAYLRVAPIDDSGELMLDELDACLDSRTRLLSVTHMSNALGTVNPIREIATLVHRAEALLLVDGAQAAYHMPVDVQSLGCDFYVVTGHKLYGPTGIGALWGREALLEQMPPWQGGGDMIRSVTFERSTWNDLPYKFEAGTPHVEGAIGLGAAVDYLSAIGMEQLAAHERELLDYGTTALQSVPGLKLIGTAARKASILSFVMDDLHPHDIGTIVDQEGIAIRTGHHCAQPVMDRFGVPATARASLALYNTTDDLDRLVAALQIVRKVLG